MDREIRHVDARSYCTFASFDDNPTAPTHIVVHLLKEDEMLQSADPWAIKALGVLDGLQRSMKPFEVCIVDPHELDPSLDARDLVFRATRRVSNEESIIADKLVTWDQRHEFLRCDEIRWINQIAFTLRYELVKSPLLS